MMKKWRKWLNLGLLSSLIPFGIGCKTIQPPSPEVLKIQVEEVTAIAVSRALRDHPDWKPYFVEAKGRLAELLVKADDNKVTLAELLDVLKKLPLRELQSDDAKLVIEVASILFFNQLNQVEIQTPARVKAVAEGIAAGLERGGVK